MKVKSFRNTKIKTKLLILGTVSIFGLLLVGGVSIFTTKQINQAGIDISRDWLPSITIAEELNTATSDYRIKECYHVVTRDSADMRRLEIEMLEIRGVINNYFQEYESYTTGNTDRELMAEARAVWDEYLQYSDNILAISRENNLEPAMNLIVDESQQLFDKASSLFMDVVEFNKQGALQSTIHGNQLYMRLTRMKVIGICMISSFITIMVIYIIRGIEKPVEDIVEGTRRVANGDLNVYLDYDSDDEIGVLTDSINQLIYRLRDIIEDEIHLFKEIGNENFEVGSECQQAYRGDFAPILYSIESLKSRLERMHWEQRKDKPELPKPKVREIKGRERRKPIRRCDRLKMQQGARELKNGDEGEAGSRVVELKAESARPAAINTEEREEIHDGNEVDATDEKS